MMMTTIANERISPRYLLAMSTIDVVTVHDDNDELLTCIVGASDFYITCTQIDCTKHTSLRAPINDTYSAIG